MTIKINQTELAWAAGFFDGEGSFVLGRPTPNTMPQFRVQLAQTDSRQLKRFKNTVAGLGNVTGPYKSQSPKHRVKWTFNTARFEHSQAILAMLWKYLCPIKREQAKRVLVTFMAARNNLKPNLRGVALWGALAKAGKPLPPGAKLRWVKQ